MSLILPTVIAVLPYAYRPRTLFRRFRKGREGKGHILARSTVTHSRSICQLLIVRTLQYRQWSALRNDRGRYNEAVQFDVKAAVY